MAETFSIKLSLFKCIPLISDWNNHDNGLKLLQEKKKAFGNCASKYTKANEETRKLRSGAFNFASISYLTGKKCFSHEEGENYDLGRYYNFFPFFSVWDEILRYFDKNMNGYIGYSFSERDRRLRCCNWRYRSSNRTQSASIIMPISVIETASIVVRELSLDPLVLDR